MIEVLTGHVWTVPRHPGSRVRPDLKPDLVVIDRRRDHGLARGHRNEPDRQPVDAQPVEVL